MRSLLTALIVGLSLNASAAVQPIQEVFEPTGTYDPAKYMKVAVVQWAPGVSPLLNDPAKAEKIKERNRLELAAYIKEAASKGAQIIITSEFGVTGYPDIPELPSEEDNFRNRDDIAPYVETVPGPSSTFFGKLAKQLGVYIQFGMAEVDSQGKDFFNSAVVVDPQGDVVAVHHKVSLFHQENAYLTPGKGVTTYDTPVGTIGMLICADVYHSSLLTGYRTKKVDVLALSTSWAQWNTGWGYFTSAATSVGSYMLAANQHYFPDSGVIEPSGKVQSHIRQTLDGIAYGYLPLKNRTVR